MTHSSFPPKSPQVSFTMGLVSQGHCSPQLPGLLPLQLNQATCHHPERGCLPPTEVQSNPFVASKKLGSGDN